MTLFASTYHLLLHISKHITKLWSIFNQTSKGINKRFCLDLFISNSLVL